MLRILKKIDDQAPVILSLNDQEAADISKANYDVKKIDPSKKILRITSKAGFL